MQDEATFILLRLAFSSRLIYLMMFIVVIAKWLYNDPR